MTYQGVNVCEESHGDHVFWRVTFDQSRSGLYPTREDALKAGYSMLDLKEAIAKLEECED